jgi:uncharacterized repeat protein (TIGR01451 family)
MRRTILLLSTMTIAVLAVSGAMLFGTGKPAQAQETYTSCTSLGEFCLDKTAPSTATVGEPITFTITERCLNPSGCIIGIPLVDQLPSELTVVSVADSQANYECSWSENTVTCPGTPTRFSSPTVSFTLTIVATPTECGSFTNRASNSINTVEAPFTVVGCPPPTKEECKNGGWMEYGFPDQGRCVSAWNRQNRQETEV